MLADILLIQKSFVVISKVRNEMLFMKGGRWMLHFAYFGLIREGANPLYADVLTNRSFRIALAVRGETFRSQVFGLPPRQQTSCYALSFPVRTLHLYLRGHRM